jgi:hypothetical protein
MPAEHKCDVFTNSLQIRDALKKVSNQDRCEHFYSTAWRSRSDWPNRPTLPFFPPGRSSPAAPSFSKAISGPTLRELHPFEKIDKAWVCPKTIVNGIDVEKDHQVRLLSESLLKQLQRSFDITQCKINPGQVG